MKSIGLTKFALRHFDPKAAVTKILDVTPEEFEKRIQQPIEMLDDPRKYFKDKINLAVYVREGDFPFSRLVTIKNTFTNARLSTMVIDITTAQYLRSDYSARVESELPVLSRWIQLPPPLKPPAAEYLTIVLYSAEQLMKEKESTNSNEIIDFSWGVVAILAHNSTETEPIPPATMIRNALGEDQGGNGVPLDTEKYKASVEFWRNHALIKY